MKDHTLDFDKFLIDHYFDEKKEVKEHKKTSYAFRSNKRASKPPLKLITETCVIKNVPKPIKGIGILIKVMLSF
jgi:hypothetical protein